mmetsp:Transcript_8943/g.19883  ORF Transcript_8943/g.19883 Transcript_8943/m.19883 type:complete len:257 (+) Transcript_8943:1165-1935(+)
MVDWAKSVGPLPLQQKQVPSVSVHVDNSHVQQSQGLGCFLRHEVSRPINIPRHREVLDESQDIGHKALDGALHDFTIHLNAGSRCYRDSRATLGQAIDEVGGLLSDAALSPLHTSTLEVLTLCWLEDCDLLTADLQGINLTSLASIQRDWLRSVLGNDILQGLALTAGSAFGHFHTDRVFSLQGRTALLARALRPGQLGLWRVRLKGVARGRLEGALRRDLLHGELPISNLHGSKHSGHQPPDAHGGRSFGQAPHS